MGDLVRPRRMDVGVSVGRFFRPLCFMHGVEAIERRMGFVMTPFW